MFHIFKDLYEKQMQLVKESFENSLRFFASVFNGQHYTDALFLKEKTKVTEIKPEKHIENPHLQQTKNPASKVRKNP